MTCVRPSVRVAACWRGSLMGLEKYVLLLLAVWCTLAAHMGVVSGYSLPNHQQYQQEDQGKLLIIYG